jgi:dipeptidyl aminopeptidase/acylaminoacyl peptidase
MVMRRFVLLMALIALLAVLVVSEVMLVLKEPAQAAFSGQNGKIAFQSLRVGFDTWYEIYTMNTDGSSTTRLTDNAVHDISASWSPDGTKIAYHAGGCRSDGTQDVEIYTMNADGSGQTNVTNSPGACDNQPAWQPRPVDPPQEPTTKQQCKDGGWRDFGFPNQGQCIKAVKQAS